IISGTVQPVSLSVDEHKNTEIEMFVEQLANDYSKLLSLFSDSDNTLPNKVQQTQISLCAKWAPTESSHYDKEPVYAAKNIAKGLNKTMKEYRIILSSLRKHLSIVERHLSLNECDKIEFDKMPAIALKKLKATMSRNVNSKKVESQQRDKLSKRYNNYLDKVTHGNGIIKNWTEMLSEVLESKTKLNKEVKYHSQHGERIMQVNAIPEYNESTLESVLVVSHDITEMKKIELEIHAKNKNISESITYSKRIQNAILPDNNVIRNVLPDSFILYKPKDIVSGDFPWFMQKEDHLYLSVVDCTGHGVPGAMLSLVGYFQLNNIVDAHPGFNSAQILDELDRKVNSTLIKDTNEENIKDGMDIAFCKINPAKRVVEFSGAHRPLYHLSNGEIKEYKG
ncbi:MAG: DUF2828 family protein, partial [Flavobacterium sp.]